MKKAVFFDLGGTLMVMRRDRMFHRVLKAAGHSVSLEAVHSAYVKVEPAWLGKYGNMELSADATEKAYRVKDAMVFESLFQDSPPGEADRVVALTKELRQAVEKEVPYELYPDAAPTLERLGSDGFRTALVSNAPADTVNVVKALGLDARLDSIVVSGAVGYSKPHPEIFRIALREVGVSPDEALHVGDVYESDVVGAQSAGILGVLVDRDGSRPDVPCPRIPALGEVYRFLT